MATLKEIEEAIKSIETKKQSLKQSFHALQNHSHSFSSFTLSWPQIDSHFSHIQSSLLSRFSLLQQNHQSLPQFHHQNPKIDQKIQSLPELEQTLDAKYPKIDQKKPSLSQFEQNNETPDDQNPKNDQKVQFLPKLERSPDDKNPQNDQKGRSLPHFEQNKETPGDQNPINGQNIQSLPELEHTLDDKNLKNDEKEQSLHNLKQNGEDPDDRNSQKVYLKSICEKMEGKKLRKLVKDSLELGKRSVNELSEGLKYAPDPFRLVLDAIEGYKPRLSSVILFESLMMIEGVEFSEEMRNRAKCVAFKWKDELNKESKSLFDALGLLSLLACFKLVNDFDKDYVIELVYLGSKDVRTRNLCRALGLEDRVLELVQKLISNERELTAIKFIHEFKLVDQFSLVRVLKSYLENAQKKINKRRKHKKNDPMELIDCDVKEKAVLNTVVKYIKDYKLESEYPPETFEPQIKELEELIDNRMNKKQQKIMGQLQYEVPVNHTGSVSTSPEQHYLQPPIKYVKDNKHESEYPPEALQQQIEKLDELRDNRMSKKQENMMPPQQYEGLVNYTGSVSTSPQQYYLQPPVKDCKLESEYPPETIQQQIMLLGDGFRDNRRRKKQKMMMSLQQYEVPVNYTGSVSTHPQQH